MMVRSLYLLVWPARQRRVSLTWELRVWVAWHVGSDDEDPNGSTVGVKRRRDIMIRLGDQHNGALVYTIAMEQR